MLFLHVYIKYIFVNKYFVVDVLNKPVLVSLDTVEWFQVLLCNIANILI